MENLYLQEINEFDIDNLTKYNKNYEDLNLKGWSSKDGLSGLITGWKEDLNNNQKVHFYPYWLMEDNEPVGLIILKDNIEVDEMWREYGGNISYVIIPNRRKKGYGTIALHLALEKCRELNLENVLVTAYEENIGSRKVIKNNFGVLKDTCIDCYDKLSCRYIINVDESLKLYNKKVR